MGINFLFLLLCCTFMKLNHGERLHEQIYSSIEGGAACFRRLNGTHQAGCSSSSKGAIGVVHMVKEVNDAQWLVYNGSAGPYMAVVSTALFKDIIDLFLDQSFNVAGILLYDNATARATSFTQESTCPNEYTSAKGSTCSPEGKNVWNPNGTGLIQRDIPFPIFYLPDSRLEEITKIEECYERFNLDRNAQNGRPLCSVQLNSFMWAAVNSIVCRRRSAASALITTTKICDPLGDKNVYYSLFPRKKATELKKKVILVTARIDTASLFDGIAPGAASSVVGMVTLITAATALSKMIPDTNTTQYDNVLWTLLNGEAFDYIGSQRIAYDLSRGAWPPDAPLTPANIKLHVEIGQIGGALSNHKDDASWPLHAYSSDDPVTIQNILEFLVELNNNMNLHNMSISQEFTQNLPPSSLHSFRRILSNFTENGELPELLLTDHKSTFTNMFYHSVLDDYDSINFKYRNISIGSDGTFIPTADLITKGNMTENDPQVKIARVASAISRTLYKQIIGENYLGDETASAHLVDEILYCFLENKMCNLFTAAEYGVNPIIEDPSPPRPLPLYVGVATWSTNTAGFAGHLLTLLTGKHLKLNQTECDAANNPDYSYYWLRGWNHSGICIETNMNFSEAISPAFIASDYDFTSGVYSTWTESVWQSMWARVFVSAGGGGSQVALIAGLIVTIITALLTYWLQRNVNIVFVNAPPDSIRSSNMAPGILRTVNC